MPAEMEAKLRQEAAKRRLTGERRDAYIYGTMRKTGWRPSDERVKADLRPKKAK
jgi:hypothetical protein